MLLYNKAVHTFKIDRLQSIQLIVKNSTSAMVLIFPSKYVLISYWEVCVDNRHYFWFEEYYEIQIYVFVFINSWSQSWYPTLVGKLHHSICHMNHWIKYSTNHNPYPLKTNHISIWTELYVGNRPCETKNGISIPLHIWPLLMATFFTTNLWITSYSTFHCACMGCFDLTCRRCYLVINVLQRLKHQFYTGKLHYDIFLCCLVYAFYAMFSGQRVMQNFI